MANLKEIRARITSVTSTKQITSAMKVVSASKLKKSQDAILKLRPYADKLKNLLEAVLFSLDQEKSNSVFAQQQPVKKVLLLVITSNRGLCGAFNANIIKLAHQQIKDYEKQNIAFDLLLVGKKAFDFFSKRYPKVVLYNESKLWENLHFDSSKVVSSFVLQEFSRNHYQSVQVVYQYFKNAAVQEVSSANFLPITFDYVSSGSNKLSHYIFEPTQDELLLDLIPRMLHLQFYKFLLDTQAAEHAARMLAMNKATDNASSLLKALKLTYNKARQAAITNEILEIVSGAEALKGA